MNPVGQDLKDPIGPFRILCWKTDNVDVVDHSVRRDPFCPVDRGGISGMITQVAYFLLPCKENRPVERVL